MVAARAAVPAPGAELLLSTTPQRRADSLVPSLLACTGRGGGCARQSPQPDTGIGALWRRFVDCEEELWPTGVPPESPFTAADFPAWLLLREPGLNLQLALDLPIGNTPAEETYRTVHRWIDARRANRTADELALRKALQADHPVLFRYLKRSV